MMDVINTLFDSSTMFRCIVASFRIIGKVYKISLSELFSSVTDGMINFCMNNTPFNSNIDLIYLGRSKHIKSRIKLINYFRLEI